MLPQPPPDAPAPPPSETAVHWQTKWNWLVGVGMVCMVGLIVDLSGLDRTANPSRPILVTPLIPSNTRFDPNRFHGKAILLQMDNSVTSMPIHEDGHVIVHGMNLLDPKNPILGKQKWTLHWPE